MKQILSLLIFCASYSTVLAQPGYLDTNFGDGGTVVVPHLASGLDDRATCVLVQPDQTILVAARSFNGTTWDLALLRFNEDGTTDPSFGNNGAIIHSFGDGNEIASSIALDVQGRILVCGTAYSDVANTTSDIFIARFLANGNLDGSFNDGSGFLIRSVHQTEDGEQGHVVIAQPDGKIMMVGQTGPSLYPEILHERYLEDGTLDSTLEGDGSSLPYTGTSRAHALAGKLDGNGNLLLAGYASLIGSSERKMLLFSINPDGSITNDFGASNGVTLNTAESNTNLAYAIAITPNGNVLLGGVRIGDRSEQMISRYTADGLVDNSFGTDGSVFLNTTTPYSDVVNDILVDSDGKILVAGSFGNAMQGRNWVVSRLNADGSYDLTFNMTGSNVSTTDDGDADCVQLALFSNDKILGAGWARVDGNNHIVLRKYLKDISTSVEPDQVRSLLSAFPNPTDQNIMVTFTLQHEDKIALRLLDAQGRIVQQAISGRSFAEGEHRINVDLEQLPEGLYELDLRGTEHRWTTRIVKN
ncbi:MAG: T9SS type A sorting domain-containing protein [Flavobacteriales bacterium]|nr:T9SS type A sorting domain-containing protein [Flavobacteriales bacterium]MBK7242039.1 T9SS type A sorting domain-containing protein [Flavobacteriales bacterium]MBP9137447.1 T9SS type A sorting domain-containing protein [Flavobacteriales bacterium]HQV51953.1 T9SS type A sorting domain-containing protein [Flavobacteriales bacterium]HQX29282.1 T9SS type A sorting domain-containing protein [Flavobacteriales bacterium]